MSLSCSVKPDSVSIKIGDRRDIPQFFNVGGHYPGVAFPTLERAPGFALLGTGGTSMGWKMITISMINPASGIWP